jgi:hypothetical protein
MSADRHLASQGQDGSDLDMEDDAAYDWEKIGNKVLAKSRRVPTIDFMWVTFHS